MNELINVNNGKKTFLKFFIGILFLHGILFVWMRMYPFVDLSFHLAAATIYRHIGETGNYFSDYYIVDAFLKPNTFHLWFCSLPVFENVEAGNKTFYTIYVLLLPLSMYFLIKEINGNKWTVLLSFLLLYNYSALFGFIGYTFAIPVVILIFYFFARSLREESLLNYLLIALLLVSLFFMHALVTIYAIAVLCAGIILCNVKQPVKILFRSIVIIPVLIVLTYWWRTTQRDSDTIGFLVQYYQSEYFKEILTRINFLYLDNMNLYNGLTGNIVATLFSLAIFIPLIYSIVINRKDIFNSLKNAQVLFAWIIFLSSAACFFFLPSWLPPDEVIIYERFSVFLILGAIVVLSIYLPSRLNQKFSYLCIFVSMVHLGLWADFYIQFQHENRFFTESIFPDQSKGKRLAGFIRDYYYRRVHCYIMYPDYFITWKKGIGATSAIDYRFGAVRRKANEQVLPRFDHWLVEKNNYKGEYDNMEYILTKGDLPGSFKGSVSKYKMVNEKGPWKLYEKEE